MSKDELDAQIPPERPPKIIHPEVYYKQLSEDFVPAVKLVSIAGQNLLKNYNAFQKSSDEYLRAMYALVKSADRAMIPAKRQSSELSSILAEYGRAIEAHKPCIDTLTVIVQKISAYGSHEKDKLKEDHATYKKQEKEILKARKKQLKNESDVDAFYREASAKWNHQQEMRYKFFNEKHRQWFEKYGEMVGKINFNKLKLNQPVVEAPVPDDWHEQQHNEPAAIVVAPPATNAVVEDHALTKTEKDRASTNTSLASELDDLPSRRLTSEYIPGITLLSTTRRESAYQPVQGVNGVNISTQSLQNQSRRASNQNYTTTGGVALVGLTNDYREQKTQYQNVEVQSERRTYTNDGYENQVVREQYRQTREVDQPAGYRNDYQESYQKQPVNYAKGTSKPAIAGGVPLLGLTSNNRSSSPVAPSKRFSNQPEAPYSVVTSKQIPVGRVVENPMTEEEMNRKKYQVDSNYDPISSPAHQKPSANRNANEEVFVPTQFTPSQYGSILIVNDDFNASSGEQVTVNRGDKVILLKSGTRGWVYVRDAVTGRTGWIPAPYVNQ
ncbi:unnamed protein product [Caenorhabditis auriculariae]|uniref:SH3 domain-containing protein n=1 Tax=Caenorhabditis auriculariae TaxID=2777116 RepID=A0A8S1H6D7_9PELO|nr:unnamed protein product [Caenorhabditis auriculariae]